MHTLRLLRAPAKRVRCHASLALDSSKPFYVTDCHRRQSVRCSSTDNRDSTRAPSRPPFEHEDKAARSDLSLDSQSVSMGGTETERNAEAEKIDVLQSFSYPRGGAGSLPVTGIPDSGRGEMKDHFLYPGVQEGSRTSVAGGAVDSLVSESAIARAEGPANPSADYPVRTASDISAYPFSRGYADGESTSDTIDSDALTEATLQRIHAKVANATDDVVEFVESLESLSQAAKKFAHGAEHPATTSYYHKLKEHFATLDMPEIAPKPEPGPALLIDQDQLDRYLKPLYGRDWRIVYVRKIKTMLDGSDQGVYAKALMRHFKFEKSVLAQEFFDQIMAIIKEENHHPALVMSSHDILVRFHTHQAFTNEEEPRTARGITLHDVRLAQLISSIPSPVPLPQRTDTEYLTPTLVKYVHLHSAPINPFRDKRERRFAAPSQSSRVSQSPLFPPPAPCPICGGPHWVRQCPKVRAK